MANNYYFDLSVTGSSGAGTEPSPWTHDDAIAGSGPAMTDEANEIRIKGMSLTDDIIRLDNSGNGTVITNWPESPMEPYGILGSIVEPVNKLSGMKRAITDESVFSSVTELESCLVIAKSSADVVFNKYAGSGAIVTLDIRGSTFKVTDGNVIEFDYATAVTVNIDSCLFIDAIFDAPANVTINCTNCTFIGKTQAEVATLTFGTTSFSTCRFQAAFDAGSPAFPSAIASVLNNDDGKYSVFFDRFVPDSSSELLTGTAGYNYSLDGKGLFGGERRGVGAWWFCNTYRVRFDTTSSHGTGDGLTENNSFGTDGFQDFMNGTINSGRYIRERDKFNVRFTFGADTWSVAGGSEPKFPGALTTMGYFSADPATASYYRGCEFFALWYGRSNYPVKINMSAAGIDQNAIDYGLFNTFECLMIECEHILNNSKAVYFNNCVFVNSTGLKLHIDDPYIDIYYKGCTFAAPYIELKGGDPTAKTIYFKYSYFAEHNGNKCQLIDSSPIDHDYIINIDGNCRVLESSLGFSNGVGGTLVSSAVYNVQVNASMPLTVGYDYNFLIFENFDRAGSLQISEYGSGSFDDTNGLYNSPRMGAGVFSFSTAGMSPSEYYVDFSQVSDGSGSSASPWNKDQFISYFANDGDVAEAANGDLIRCKGNAKILTESFVTVNIGRYIHVDIEGWRAEGNNPFIIEVDSSLVSSDVSLFHLSTVEDDDIDPEISVKDMVALAPTGSCLSFTLFKLFSAAPSIDIEFFNSIIIADVPFHITDKSNFEGNFYGSTVSIGSNGSFQYSPSGTSYFRFYDCVLNFQCAFPGDYHKEASVNVTLDHCETNALLADLSPDTDNGSTYEKEGPALLPETLVADTFDADNFTYFDFRIENDGNGVAFWDLNSFNHGIKWNDRKGIGAFYFAVARDLYVDGDSIISGNGLEETPFSFEQLRNYFSPDVGSDCGIDPSDGDTIYIKGTLNTILSGSQDIFVIKRNLAGTVTMKAWEIDDKGVWLVETENLPDSTDIFFIRVAGEQSIDNLIVKDFALAQNNGGTSNVKMINASFSSGGMNLFFKNFMVYSKNKIEFGVRSLVTMNCYGFTLNADEVDFTSQGDLKGYDGVVNANTLIDNTYS